MQEIWGDVQAGGDAVEDFEGLNFALTALDLAHIGLGQAHQGTDGGLARAGVLPDGLEHRPDVRRAHGQCDAELFSLPQIGGHG